MGAILRKPWAAMHPYMFPLLSCDNGLTSFVFLRSRVLEMTDETNIIQQTLKLKTNGAPYIRASYPGLLLLPVWPIRASVTSFVKIVGKTWIATRASWVTFTIRRVTYRLLDLFRYSAANRRHNTKKKKKSEEQRRWRRERQSHRLDSLLCGCLEALILSLTHTPLKCQKQFVDKKRERAAATSLQRSFFCFLSSVCAADAWHIHFKHRLRRKLLNLSSVLL